MPQYLTLDMRELIEASFLAFLVLRASDWLYRLNASGQSLALSIIPKIRARCDENAPDSTGAPATGCV